MENKTKPLSGSRRLAMRGVMIPLAMILSWVESLIPFSFAVPGAKLGLANTVTVLALLRLGPADALLIGTIRVVLTSILFGNFVMMVYSLAGACFSILIMSLCARSKKFGIIGISIAGAVSHNLGQCLAAAVLMQNRNIMWYLPLLILYGVIAGLVTGIISSEILKRI
ncbi:MAG: Gx transporter family protein [Flexilinea sp.]|nr:Gx transporter family protein [Flexilinea sp.]